MNRKSNDKSVNSTTAKNYIGTNELKEKKYFAHFKIEKQFNMPLKQLLIAFIFFIFFIFSSGLSSALEEVHIHYDWWEPTVTLDMPEPYFASCAACHKSLGVAGGVHETFRKYCEDCHLPGRTGPFVFYEAINLYRNFNYSAPMVYNHIINASNDEIYYEYTGDIVEVEDQSQKFGGEALSSCFGWNPETDEGTCHGISELNQIDGFFAFSLTENDQPARQDPYLYTLDVSSLPNTTDCLYCHTQDNQEIVVAWGGATQTDVTHFNAVTKEDCYNCHVDPSITLSSFHRMGPEPNVIFLEQPLPTPSPPPQTQTPPPTTLPPTTAPPETTLPPETPPPTTLPPTTAPPETTLPPTTTNIYQTILDSIRNLLQRLLCLITQSC